MASSQKVSAPPRFSRFDVLFEVREREPREHRRRQPGKAEKKFAYSKRIDSPEYLLLDDHEEQH